MPTFTRDDVQRLAALARLELSAEEIDLFARQLTDIIEFAREIQEVDTSSLIVDVKEIADDRTLRDDLVLPSLERNEVLEGAANVDPAAGLFKVPRVLNG